MSTVAFNYCITLVVRAENLKVVYSASGAGEKSAIIGLQRSGVLISFGYHNKIPQTG